MWRRQYRSFNSFFLLFFLPLCNLIFVWVWPIRDLFFCRILYLWSRMVFYIRVGIRTAIPLFFFNTILEVDSFRLVRPGLEPAISGASAMYTTTLTWVVLKERTINLEVGLESNFLMASFFYVHSDSRIANIVSSTLLLLIGR